MNNKAIVTLQKMKSYIQTQEELDHINFAIKSLEKIQKVEKHKFLTPDNPEYFNRLPEPTKGYQQGWNDALNAFAMDFKEDYK